MAVVLNWRANMFTRGQSRRTRASAARPRYSIDLDVSDFGSPLPIHEFLLEPTKTPDSEFPTWPRVILIPSPPPIPSHEMLVAATRVLHPHVFAYTPTSAVEAVSPSSGSQSASSASQIWQPDGMDVVSTPEVTDPNASGSSGPSGPMIQCVVCMDNRDPSDFPTGNITSKCNHPSLTCRRCLEYSIASDHTTKMWYDIQCPQCYQKLAYEDVKKYADMDTFAHYDALTNRRALSAMPNFVWCTSCPSGQVHDTESPTTCPSVTCNECSAITCFNHRTPWHTGLSCQQYDRLLKRSTFTTLTSLFPRSVSPSHILTSTSSKRPLSTSSDPTVARAATEDVKEDVIEKVKVFKRDQEASLRDIKRACKRCPGRACGAMIYKIDGCKHMTCSNCSYEFCWGCGKDWFYGHKCWLPWRRG